MAAATVTGKEIRQALAEYMGGWVFLGESDGTSAASYITDTERLKGVNLPASLFDNCVVRIASGSKAGEMAYVDHVDFVNGRLYITPDLTGAIASGDDYEVWMRGIDPDIVDRLRDDCLARFCSTWRPTALTEITDGDLQDSGVTNWTVAGGATRSKAYSSFPDAYWRRELRVVHTTAATDYVKSASLYVNPGERYFLQCAVRAYVTATSAAATASIVVRDITNGADISLGGIKTSHIGRGQGHISLLWTVPAGCYEIQVWLKSNTDASTTAWGPFYCHKRDKTRKSLPDRITTKKRVGNFWVHSQVNPAQSEQADSFYKSNKLSVERVQVGSQVEVNFHTPTTNNAISYYERGFYDRLQSDYLTVAGRSAGDTASTDCPKEYIVAALAERVSKWMLDTHGAEWQDDWVRASTELAYWEGEFGPEPQYVEEVTTPVGVPQITV